MSAYVILVAALPWVTRLEVAVLACDGYRWSHMPGKALRDPELMETYRCRNWARWQFTALPPDSPVALTAQDGLYCWSHLLVQLRSSPAEEERTAQGLRAARRDMPVQAFAEMTGKLP